MQQLLKNLIDQYGEEFEYCLHLVLADNKQLYLTTAGQDLLIDNKLYKANSGFKILQITSNEGGQDSVKIQIASNYLTLDDDLLNAKLDLKLVFTKTLLVHYNYYTLYPVNIYQNSIGYTIIDAQPVAIKLQQNLLNIYSKTCRTRFGDSKCRINTEFYSYIVEIESINDKELVLKHIAQDSGYFTAGKIMLPVMNTVIDSIEDPINQTTEYLSDIDSNVNYSNNHYITIIKHLDNILLVEKIIPMRYKDLKTIKIIAGCDKKFATCCGKYNNAINFRGEPCIPGNKILI